MKSVFAETVVDKNQISDYVKEYNFQEETSFFRKCFFNSKGGRNFFRNDKEETLKKLFEEFWEKPSIDIHYLGLKYSIPSNVNIWTVIQSYSNEEYIRFLRDRWGLNTSTDELVIKYGLGSIKYVYNLTKPLYLHTPNKICCRCRRSDTFFLMLTREYDTTGEIGYMCSLCYQHSDTLLDSNEAFGKVI